MTPLELVLGAVVKKVTVSFSGETPKYSVLVKLPDGREYRIQSDSYRSERKIAKRVGLKMTTKAAKAAAQVLKEAVLKAVEDFKADPGTAQALHKAKARALVNATRAAERRELQHRENLKAQMTKIMVELHISLEEVTDLWKKSVVMDVMDVMP